jgi:hypothetical protein
MLKAPKPMAKKRIWHVVAIVAGTLLGALVAAVVEKVFPPNN